MASSRELLWKPFRRCVAGKGYPQLQRARIRHRTHTSPSTALTHSPQPTRVVEAYGQPSAPPPSARSALPAYGMEIRDPTYRARARIGPRGEIGRRRHTIHTTNHRHLPYNDADGTHRLKMRTRIRGEIIGAPHMLRACQVQRTHTAKRSCSLCIDLKG